MMTTDFRDDEERDNVDRGAGRGQVSRPETDLTEGNSSRHFTEDYRRTIDPDQGDLWVDPQTGVPHVLP